jgi:hypothetical protein
MANTETRNMLRWKVAVVLTIVATANLVLIGTYTFLKEDEEANFQDSVSCRSTSLPLLSYPQPLQIAHTRIRCQTSLLTILHAMIVLFVYEYNR